MECWWEGSTSTAMPPTSASELMDQQYKLGDTTCRAALVFLFYKTHKKFPATKVYLMLFDTPWVPEMLERNCHMT